MTTDLRTVALTFDDGPDPAQTPAVLDALARTGTHATFFVLGERARRWPALVTALRDAGHEVALHGPTHDRVTGTPFRTLTPMLREARRMLEDLTGTAVRWYRPPFGAQSLRSYLAARRAGLDVVVWSHDARDWLPRSTAEIATDATRNLAPGSILLLHDGLVRDPVNPTPPTMFNRGVMTGDVLAALHRIGMTGTTVSGLLGRGSTYRTAWFRP